PERRVGRGRKRNRGDDQERGAGENCRNTEERRAQADRIVPNVEGRAAPPEQARGREAPQCLLEVEPFDEVEHAEREEQYYSDVERAPAPAVEVERGHDQRRGRRQRDRVEDPDLVERLDIPQQETVSPAGV